MILSRSKINVSFHIICFAGVCFMIGYWWYKYHVEDKDIGVVDYADIERAEEIEYPSGTLCLKDPFILEKLRQYNSSIDQKSYLRYLKGDLYEEHYEKIDFDKVTFNLHDFFLNSYESWKNESSWRSSSLQIKHVGVFSGFAFEKFLKCFWIEYRIEKHRYIDGLYVDYDFRADINDQERCHKLRPKLFFKVHYPNQFFLGENLMKSNPCTHTGVYYWIDELEILKRRNGRHRACLENSHSFDDMVLEKHMSGKRCRPPYLTSYTFLPVCNTSEEIKQFRLDYEVLSATHVPKSCQRISKMTTTIDSEQQNWKQEWTFTIEYPDEVRIITQDKQIDIHSLIGNIGGYIGLLLGKQNSLIILIKLMV